MTMKEEHSKEEREKWIINLEEISSQINAETVKFVCGKYGAGSIYDLHSCDLHEAWNELYQYAVEANT